ncbi:MAG: SRPBCC domain-containing protein [Cyclobacteriaceae bacterium]
METNFDIHHDLYVENSKADKVFEAITIPKHLNNWWPLKSSGEPKVGTTYNFYFTPEYDWNGEVIQSEPYKTFHVKMTSADKDWTPTSFGFDLEEVEGGVSVQFWHFGWPERNHHYRRSSWCWAILLKGLKDYVEKGVIVPFGERE